METIPKAVTKAFSNLIYYYGNHVSRLGRLRGCEYFIFNMPDDEETGFPQIVGYKDGDTFDVEGFAALDIVDSINLKD